MANISWSEISTVLIDMDGTILDLHFDNHFWLEHLPLRYSEKMSISVEAAKAKLKADYLAVVGTIEWYCLDYWSEQTQMPIKELKREIQHLIQLRSDAKGFLLALRASGKDIVMVTNAHPEALSLKIERTQIDQYFDTLYSTHEFGVSKESQLLWQRLQEKHGFDCDSTLFIDDSIEILKSAQQYGIKHLLAIANPDSKKSATIITDFPAITNYEPLTAKLNSNTAD
ncbi:GMP/IMP nucleotidase [Colwellia psychrerythraea]|uniref:HAD-superfamily hydrolase, subfamily IA, variant 3 n=1 Tax=Colwellia psychrerythraea TaxID=28229 RepID=A0A099KHN5_COLPS|nr:GMP/IMP nucleotidase [Colwellia psychrerythraea]KGJ89770.1 HAD-superfamily hydrolase, subfamily IA, variant 3 [Colwellia psychrerythraea]